MKKLSLFLFLGLFFAVTSCDKSAKTEDLGESVNQTETQNIVVSETQNTVLILPGMTSVDVRLPDGRTIQMDVPIELQLKEDGTPKADRPASSRAGDCNNVISIYPSANSGTVANLSSDGSKVHFAGQSRIAPLNENTTSNDIYLFSGGNAGYTFEAENSSFTNSVFLIIGSWDCSGGKFDFVNLSFQGDYSGADMGSISICKEKCGYN